MRKRLCINRTFMELKLYKAFKSLPGDLVLIEPLWN